MIGVTPEPIMKIALGFMASKHLFTASEIGLFEALGTGPATLQELADETGVPLRTLGIVTAAMVSMGLVVQDGNQYRNSEAASVYLAGQEGPDLRSVLRFFDQITYPEWQQFTTVVRTDQGRSRFGEFTPEQQKTFSTGVEAFSGLGAAALAASYDFSSHRRILDVAGGTGSFLLAALRRYPALKGTLFELPGACAVARKRLAKEPEANRIDVVEGDLFKDPLPDGHDALIVANTVHVLSASHNIELMRKMRGHTQPGARLLLVDMWTNHSHSQPLAAALMSGTFLLTSGEGQAYSEKEASAWLEQTGWRNIGLKSLAGPSSLIVAEAA
jgi:SAM-dependent methyltransferase